MNLLMKVARTVLSLCATNVRGLVAVVVWWFFGIIESYQVGSGGLSPSPNFVDLLLKMTQDSTNICEQSGCVIA